jgi:hypothetical protein
VDFSTIITMNLWSLDGNQFTRKYLLGNVFGDAEFTMVMTVIFVIDIKGYF